MVSTRTFTFHTGELKIPPIVNHFPNSTYSIDTTMKTQKKHPKQDALHLEFTNSYTENSQTVPFTALLKPLGQKWTGSWRKRYWTFWTRSGHGNVYFSPSSPSSIKKHPDRSSLNWNNKKHKQLIKSKEKKLKGTQLFFCQSLHLSY